MSLEDIYTAEWFAHDFEHLQPEFDVVAYSLCREFLTEKFMREESPKVTDVGCGPGMILRRLRRLGATVYGLEGSQHGIDYAHDEVRGLIEHCDITKRDDLYARDLVICTEVAEHLDAEHAPHLVKLLCSAMCPIVFTAAPPGQDGHHHVNCQPKQYWIDLFAGHGAIPDWDTTASLTARWAKLQRLSHMTKSVMVFR